LATTTEEEVNMRLAGELDFDPPPSFLSLFSLPLSLPLLLDLRPPSRTRLLLLREGPHLPAGRATELTGEARRAEGRWRAGRTAQTNTESVSTVKLYRDPVSESQFTAVCEEPGLHRRPLGRLYSGTGHFSGVFLARRNSKDRE
jgi:hypothetical protein